MKKWYPLRYQLDDEVAMMKHRGKHFIDSNEFTGMTKKRQQQHLNTIRYEKWKKRILQQFFGSKMSRFPFVEARPPQDGMGWAGVLYKEERKRTHGENIEIYCVRWKEKSIHGEKFKRD